jgi:hypothetical protein
MFVEKLFLRFTIFNYPLELMLVEKIFLCFTIFNYTLELMLKLNSENSFKVEFK